MKVKELEGGEYQTFSGWLGSKIKERLSTFYEYIKDNIYVLTFGIAAIVMVASVGLYFATFQHRERFLPWLAGSGVVMVILGFSHVYKSLRRVYSRDMNERAARLRREEQKRKEKEAMEKLVKQMGSLRSRGIVSPSGFYPSPKRRKRKKNP